MERLPGAGKKEMSMTLQGLGEANAERVPTLGERADKAISLLYGALDLLESIDMRLWPEPRAVKDGVAVPKSPEPGPVEPGLVRIVDLAIQVRTRLEGIVNRL